MKVSGATLPPFLILDHLLHSWLMEDIGRGDRTTQSLISENGTIGKAQWIAKAPGIIAGLPVAARVFQLLNNQVSFIPTISEELC